jgi:cytochrome d ubiquinol oxidase subunit II
VLIGVFALVVLAGHGALYLTWKTSGPVHERSRALAGGTWVAALVLGALATAATAFVQPHLYPNLIARPWTWILVALILGGLFALFRSLKQERELPAFLGSALFIVSLLAATAAGLFPILLLSTLNEQFSLTIYNAAAGALSLRVGLIWWVLALLLAIGYFTYLFRSFRGKVTLEEEGHGY